MNWKAKVVFVLSLLLLALSTVACEREGEMEKAGKELDKAFSTMKDKIHNATE